MDNGAQSLKVDEDIVSGDKDDGVQRVPEDELDKGVLNLPLEEDSHPGEQVPSLSVDKGIVLGDMEEGVQSLPADEMEEGDQSFL